MSYANGTPHYNLPQTVGTDKRDWSDTNEAFSALDAAVYAANQGTQGIDARVTANANSIDSLTQTVTANTKNIANISNKQVEQDNSLTEMKNSISDFENTNTDYFTAYREVSAVASRAYALNDYFIYNNVLYRATKAIAAGNTIIPNTNCKATNVGSELTEVFSNTAVHVRTQSFDDSTTFTALGDALFTQINQAYVEANNPREFAHTSVALWNPSQNRLWVFSLARVVQLDNGIEFEFYCPEVWQNNTSGSSGSEISLHTTNCTLMIRASGSYYFTTSIALGNVGSTGSNKSYTFVMGNDGTTSHTASAGTKASVSASLYVSTKVFDAGSFTAYIFY